MGGQQSTRRISIDNDGDPACVIKVSEAVVDRLKGGTELLDEQEQEEETPPPPQKSVRRPGFSRRFIHVPVPENVPLQALPYITSKDIQQVLETEIEKNNLYWEKRIADLQCTHEKMNKIMEEEYVKVQEEIADLLPRTTQPNTPLPCQVGKVDVTKCYKAHPKQPLNCAAEVEQFASCLINTRIKLQQEGKI